METRSPHIADHDAHAGVLENEGSDTGCFGAFCATCTMWVGPHRDSEEEAEGDARRHIKAVQRQYTDPRQHLAVVRLDEDEDRTMKGIIESDPEDPVDFGPYFAHCDDCGAYVSLGRVTEEEAAPEAKKHREAFEAVGRPG